MHLLGLVVMLSALLVALTAGSPLTELSRAIDAQGLVPTVGIQVNYAFASFYYDIPNAQCQPPPPQFGDIKEIEFTENYQLCWFYKTPGGCPNNEMPVLLHAKDDIRRKIKFTPQAMLCYDPTFKCPGKGECL